MRDKRLVEVASLEGAPSSAAETSRRRATQGQAEICTERSMPGTDAALLSNGNFYFMGPHAERPVACRTSFQEYSHKNA